MTREKAKELLPIIQAFVDGKTIQFLSDKGKWIDIDGCDIIFTPATSRYRIKPEPKYRPFKDAEECFQEMLKHQPFGWLRLGDMHINIVCVHSVDKKIELSPENLKFEGDVPVDIERMFIPMECAFDEYLFADGTPFGVKEE